MINDNLIEVLKNLQSGEMSERLVYIGIAKFIKNEHNRETLLKIADEELKHYEIWKRYTGVDVKVSKFLVMYYTFIAKLFGYTFAIKQMEKRLNGYTLNEKNARLIRENVPETIEVLEDEQVHEKELIDLLDEERLKYVGSIVLGLNDALVEFTGSLAGYTFAMQSNKLISMVGLITGISATLSMASSEYLSSRSDGDPNAGRSAAYTGISYLFTVIVLILPYMILPEKMFAGALVMMMIFAIGIIAAFNYYISVARDYSFKKRFGEMAGISLTVSALSFVIGLLVKHFLGVDI